MRRYPTVLAASFAVAVQLALRQTALAQAAPQNLAPNSQWEIWSGVGYSTAENPQGTGTASAIAASGNTVGTVGSTVFTVTITNDLAVGELITATGAGVDPALTVAPMRITALSSNRSVTVRVPLGYTPNISHASVLTPVVVGNQAAKGTGDAADGWKKTTSMAVWREFYPVNVTSNAYYALGANKDQAGPEYIWLQFVTRQQMTQWAGRTVSFGAYGYHKVKGGSGTWRIYANDSVNGIRSCNPVAPSATYQWSECAFSIPANASYFYIGMQLDGVKSDTYYFENPVLTIGSAIGGVHNYIKPQETLIPIVHISPLTMVNAVIKFPSTQPPPPNVGYSFVFDPFADTGGQIAPTVIKAKGQLEGWNAGAPVPDSGLTRVIAWYDRSSAPGKGGSFLLQLPSQTNCSFTSNNPVRTASCAQRPVKSYMYMDMPFNHTDTTADIQGTGVLTSAIANDTWANVSLEFDEFLLQ